MIAMSDRLQVTALWPALDRPGAVAVTGWLRLAPFVDYGRTWNDGKGEDDDITSAGLGLLLDYRQFNARLYWAHAFDDIDNGNVEDDLQDDGIHFSLSYSVL